MIKTRHRIDMFLKSFFLQATWNSDRMQNLGMLFSLQRSLRFVWKKDDKNYLAACNRCLTPFNSHPYMSTAIMGGIVNMETGIRDGNVTPDELQRMKQRLAPALSALGSAWFWENLRLLSFLIVLPFLSHLSDGAVIASALIAYGFFNYHHLVTRWRGIEIGLTRGPKLQERIKQLFPKHMISVFGRCSAYLLGVSVPLVVYNMPPGRLWNQIGENVTSYVFLTVLLIALIAGFLRIRMISSYQLLGGLLVISLLIGKYL